MKRILVLIAFLLWVPAAFAQPMSVLNTDGAATLCTEEAQSCPLAVNNKGQVLGNALSDSAYSAGESGSLGLTVRDDALSDDGLSDTDGDKQPQASDNYGRTWTNSAQQTGVLLDGGTPMPPQFIKIDTATSAGDHIVIAAQTGKIRVLSYVFICTGAVSVVFYNDASASADNMTGGMSVAANAGVSSGYNPVGHFETGAGKYLNLWTNGAIGCDGHITWVEVP